MKRLENNWEEIKKLENCIDVLLEVYGDPKLGTPELTVILKLMKKKDVFVNKEFEMLLGKTKRKESITEES